MSDFSVTIDELITPTGATDPAWLDFMAMARLRNTLESEGYGTSELYYFALELLPTWLNQTYDPKRMWVARVAGLIVARATYETPIDESDHHAWVSVQVLPEWRRHGIGTALTDLLENVATADHRTDLTPERTTPCSVGATKHPRGTSKTWRCSIPA